MKPDAAGKHQPGFSCFGPKAGPHKGDQLSQELEEAPIMTAEIIAELDHARIQAQDETLEIQRKTIADLANRLEAANRKLEWRPISEAPKAGTEILVYCNGDQVTVSWSENGYWKLIQYGDYAISARLDGEPSHFIALPEPPTKPTP